MGLFDSIGNFATGVVHTVVKTVVNTVDAAIIEPAHDFNDLFTTHARLKKETEKEEKKDYIKRNIGLREAKKLFKNWYKKNKSPIPISVSSIKQLQSRIYTKETIRQRDYKYRVTFTHLEKKNIEKTVSVFTINVRESGAITIRLN